MRNGVFAHLRGAISFLYLVLNTLFWVTPFIPVAVIKLWPHPGWRRRCTRVLQWLGEGWIGGTNALVRWLPIEWNVEVPGDLRRDRRYLLICNHRAWTDILAVLFILDRRAPFPAFFVKKPLRWLPLIGLAMWALDFPFVERYSREVLERHPELRGRDLETARRACQRYREMPVLLVIFPEGTRFSRAKQHSQHAFFRYLLNPRPGGLAVIVNTLGDRMEGMLDVTLAYPPGRCGFWDFLCGRIPRLGVRVRRRQLPADLRGDYQEDLVFRRRFQEWMEGIWREKDALIAALRQEMRGKNARH